MSNAFDRDSYPTVEPEVLVAGDRWVWKREDLVSDYPISDYALSYEFHSDSGGGGSHKFTVTATEIATAYVVEVPSATTDDYLVADYQWYAFITRSSDSERVSIGHGFAKLVADYADTNADLRSHAKKVLDAVEAVIENRATIDQSSFSIGGRSLSRMDPEELLNLRDRYKAEYLREIQRARIRSGQPTGNMIGVRF